MTLGNLEPHCGENCCYAKGISEVGNSQHRVEMYESTREVKMWGYFTQMQMLDLSAAMQKTTVQQTVNESKTRFLSGNFSDGGSSQIDWT